MFEAVLPLLNTFARIPICGRIANYNQTAPPPGPNLVPRVMGLTLVRRLTFRGLHHLRPHGPRAGLPARRRRVGSGSGELVYKEDVVDGLEQAVPAFQGLLQGKNFGKLLVRVSDDPTR